MVGPEYLVLAAFLVAAALGGGGFLLGRSSRGGDILVAQDEAADAKRDLGRRVAELEEDLLDAEGDRDQVRADADATIRRLRAELERAGLDLPADDHWDRVLQRARRDRATSSGAAVAGGDPGPTDGGGDQAVGVDEEPRG